VHRERKGVRPRGALAAVALFAWLAAGGVGAAGVGELPPVGTTEGRLLPDVTFRDLDGEDVRVGALRGRVVVLNFWATWCGPCRDEMPELERLWNSVRGDGVVFLAVNLDVRDPKALRAYAERTRTGLPIVWDAAGVQGMFGVGSIPMTLIVDRRGVVRYRILGARPWAHPDYAAGLRVLAKEG